MNRRPRDVLVLARRALRDQRRGALLLGVGDSIVASIATFVIGIYATRTFELAELGVYGLLFAGVLMVVSGFTVHLYFTPVEVAFVEWSNDEQLASVGTSARRGVLLTLPSAIVVAAVVVLVLGGDADGRLVSTAILVGTLSPVQDHVRRTLHQAGWSAGAFAMSATQLGVVLIAVLTAVWAGVNPFWIPFGALGIANFCSTVFGVSIAAQRSHGARIRVESFRSSFRIGGWLVVSSQAEQLGQFGAIILLGWIAGSEAVGSFEAVRLLTQPLLVIAFGLSTVLRPEAIRAAQTANRGAAIRASGLFVGAILGLGAIYAVTFGLEWPFNPLVALFPVAFEQNGLLFAMITVSAVQFSTMILGIQLVAAGRQRALARVSVQNAPVYPVTTGLLAASLGPFAIIIAIAMDRTVWLVRILPLLGGVYADR